MMFSPEPYEPRPIRFREIWQHGEWRLKVYGIASGPPEPQNALLEAAKVTAAQRLDSVDISLQHYSVGFLGVHDGKTSNFVFVDWWADENELHHHVYTSSNDDPTRLTYTTPSGVIACTWDLRLIAFERDAWLETVLKQNDQANLNAYLEQQLNENV